MGDSPTMDEQNHIARGLAYLRTGDPRLSVEHPPLVNVLSALPLLTQNVELPTDDWSWEVGEWYRFADLLLWERNLDAERIVFLARLPVMFMGLLLGAMLFRSTRGWFGAPAGLLALVFFVLDPNILAHTRYTTTDLGATLFVFLAASALLGAIHNDYRPGWVALAGGAYGLALSAKYSSAAFGPLFALLVLIDLIKRRKTISDGIVSVGLRTVLIFPIVALAVVWGVYGLSFGPVADVGVSAPMPLFWQGVRSILRFSGGGRPAFLLGHFSTEGFWYYFPVAFGVKTPLPTLIALVWAMWQFLSRLRARNSGPDFQTSLAMILLPLLFLMLSTQSALNLGYRHLLPILPFLFAFIGGQLANRLKSLPTVLLVLWLLAGHVFIYPHYLSYFNEIVGPANGYQVLVDSNLDWGQDLKRLKQWMDNEEVERVRLAWFGTAPPAAYGVSYDPLPGLPHHFDLWEMPPFDPVTPEPGVYAISVSMLQELFRRDEDKTTFAWFREREPDDRVGYSIHIYRVGVP